MPRRAKQTQAPVAPQDSTYGESQESLVAQQQMGIPETRTAPAQGGEVATIPEPGQPGNVTDPSQILAMLQQSAPPPQGGLSRPTERPDEPVTTGLAQPIDAPSRNRAAETLELMASATGDDRFVRMAQRARMV